MTSASLGGFLSFRIKPVYSCSSPWSQISHCLGVLIEKQLPFHFSSGFSSEASRVSPAPFGGHGECTAIVSLLSLIRQEVLATKP